MKAMKPGNAIKQETPPNVQFAALFAKRKLFPFGSGAINAAISPDITERELERYFGKYD